MTRLIAALLVVGLLAGCASESADLDSDVATTLQSSVVAVAETAADGDLATSLARLDTVQEHLDAAIAEGAVSAERAALIQSAIDAVRADLEVKLAEYQRRYDDEPYVGPSTPHPEWGPHDAATLARVGAVFAKLRAED